MIADFGPFATSRRAPSGRPSNIDNGDRRVHRRVQCERGYNGWRVAWPPAGGCPAARDTGDEHHEDCSCQSETYDTFEVALAVIAWLLAKHRERVSEGRSPLDGPAYVEGLL